MTDDIVTRLRVQPNDANWEQLMLDGADEIERLREQNDHLKANVEMLLAEAREVRGG